MFTIYEGLSEQIDVYKEGTKDKENKEGIGLWTSKLNQNIWNKGRTKIEISVNKTAVEMTSIDDRTSSEAHLCPYSKGGTVS